MRVLAVTNLYPLPDTPLLGVFVKSQLDSLRNIGVDIDLMVVERRKKGIGVYMGLKRRLRQHLAHNPPDVVHCMYGGTMAALVTAASSAPTIVSFCGSDLLGQNMAGPVRYVASQYGVVSSHRAAKRASGIIVKSRNLLEALPKSVHRKVRIIPNGIDLQMFQPLDHIWCRQRLGWPDGEFHAVFPANGGDPVKRLPLAEAAVRILRGRGIPIRLHVLQGTPHSEVPLWLNAGDVLLLTSAHEGSPNVVKEALACNIPIVSVDVGDVRERIENVAGCYLALSEPEDLAEKLNLVVRRSARTEGRNRVQELSLERVASRVVELYTSVLQPKSVTRPAALV